MKECSRKQLVVKCNGTWRTRPSKGNAKKSYIFEEIGSNFSLTWWPTNGTIFVQGKKEASDIIDGILNSVIDKMEEKKKLSDIIQEQGKEPPEFRKNSDVKAKKKKQGTVKDIEENEKQAELKRIWECYT